MAALLRLAVAAVLLCNARVAAKINQRCSVDADCSLREICLCTNKVAGVGEYVASKGTTTRRSTSPAAPLARTPLATALAFTATVLSACVPSFVQGVEECPWLRNTGEVNVIECEDGHRFNVKESHWAGCLQGKHGKRIRCPSSDPFMCQANTCGGGDHCCETYAKCMEMGGLRDASMCSRPIAHTCTCQADPDAPPTTAEPTSAKPLPGQEGIELSGPNIDDAINLKECTGECDNDGQCLPGLLCYQRDAKDVDEKIPGCWGYGGGPGWDYCYDPAKFPGAVLPGEERTCNRTDSQLVGTYEVGTYEVGTTDNGDVCRMADGKYFCPTGCSKTFNDMAPYCYETGSDGKCKRFAGEPSPPPTPTPSPASEKPPSTPSDVCTMNSDCCWSGICSRETKPRRCTLAGNSIGRTVKQGCNVPEVATMQPATKVDECTSHSDCCDCLAFCSTGSENQFPYKRCMLPQDEVGKTTKQGCRRD